MKKRSHFKGELSEEVDEERGAFKGDTSHEDKTQNVKEIQQEQEDITVEIDLEDRDTVEPEQGAGGGIASIQCQQNPSEQTLPDGSEYGPAHLKRWGD